MYFVNYFTFVVVIYPTFIESEIGSVVENLSVRERRNLNKSLAILLVICYQGG